MARGSSHKEKALRPGYLLACPVCGIEVVFSCHHDGDSVQSIPMRPSEAKHLRDTYDGPSKRRRDFTCEKCGYEGPFEAGMTIGANVYCAACSGWRLTK